jgi:hypothetical protein
MGANVILVMSKECGIVIGRAEYHDQSFPRYLIRYMSGDGRLVENWWYEDAIADQA